MVRRMRTLCAGLAVLALLLAGCGGGGEEESAQTTTTQETTTATTGGGAADTASAAGKQVFTSNCGGCHTLADAGTSGQSAPNLDELRADKASIQRQVTNGGGGMPAFKDRLSAEQIDQVATYVAEVAGRS
jgi:mono/diheme cytochrome c family protein